MGNDYTRLSISDRAYENLAQLSIEAGYSNKRPEQLAPNSNTMKPIPIKKIRGIGSFISAVFAENEPEDWEDKRPQHLIELDTIEPTYNTPILYWYDVEEEARRQRNIKLSDVTIHKIVKVGIYHSVQSPRAKHLDGTIARVGLVLEVFGLNYLVPTKETKNPNPTVYKFRNPTEGVSLF